jgi:SAM-dependent methyltransferase
MRLRSFGAVSELHPCVAAFGGDAAEIYDAGRAALPASVVAAFSLPAGARVLDLAAGTGLLSTALRDAGYDVVAVEPLDAMRAQLAAKLGPDRAFAGTAEAIPLPDSSVDAVTVADAFHWFDADAAAAEIARVLRPGGTVVLLWRYTDWPDAPQWQQDIWARMAALRGEHPGFEGDAGRGAFARHGGFSPLEHRSTGFVKPSSRQGVLVHLRSISYIARLPDRERAALLAEVDAELAAAGVNEFDEPHSAHIWTARLRG